MAVNDWQLFRGEWRSVATSAATEAAAVAAAETAMTNGAGPDAPVLHTTLRTAGGKPLLAASHQARLETSCRELQWPPPPAAAGWQRLVSAEAAKAGGEIRARISLWFEENTLHGRLECSRLQAPARVILWPAPPGSERLRAGLKLINPALREWEEQAAARGAQEAILRRSDGVITETTRSNLLWSDSEGRICHPRGPALPGVMLAWALQELRAAGREIIARDASLQELESAAELFASSAVKGAIPAALAACGGPLFLAAGSGPVGKYLDQRYARLLARTAAGEPICTP